MSDISDFSDSDDEVKNKKKGLLFVKTLSRSKKAVSTKNLSEDSQASGSENEKEKEKEKEKDKLSSSKSSDPETSRSREQSITGVIRKKSSVLLGFHTPTESVPTSKTSNATLSPPEFIVSKLVHNSKCFVPRSNHSVCHSKGQIYIYGGKDNGVVMQEMFHFNPANNLFSLINPEGVNPGPKTGATLCSFSNPKTNEKQLFLFGGEETHGIESSESWIYEPETNKWKKMSSSGVAPAARRDHSCVPNKNGSALYIWGGYNSDNGVLNDMFIFKGGVWAKSRASKSASGPTGRCSHSAALYYDNYTNQEFIFIFGGDVTGKGVSTAQLWQYDIGLSQWSDWTSASGTVPDGRFKHSATVFDRRMWVSGGRYDGWFTYGTYADFYVLDIPSRCWFKCALGSNELGYHADYGSIILVPSNKSLYVFGGINHDGFTTSDVFRITPMCTTVSLAYLKTEMTTIKTRFDEMLGQLQKLESAFTSVLDSNMKTIDQISEIKFSLNDFSNKIHNLGQKFDDLSMSNNKSVEELSVKLETIEDVVPKFTDYDKNMMMLQGSIQQISNEMSQKADAQTLKILANRVENIDVAYESLSNSLRSLSNS